MEQRLPFQLVGAIPTVKLPIAHLKAIDALAFTAVKLVGVARMHRILDLAWVAVNSGFQLHAYVFFEISLCLTVAVLAYYV